jgi:undecaprenyl-diphosphatase
VRSLARRPTTPTWLLGLAVAWFAVVLGLGVAAGKLLALLENPDGSTSVDRSITTWVVAHRTDGLTTLARGLSTVGSQKVLLPAVVLVAVALIARRRLLLAALLLVAWGGGIGLYSLIKYFVARQRPPADIWLTNVGRTTSFPSGHATQSASTLIALVFVCGVCLRRTQRAARLVAFVVAFVLAVGIGWSRVYLGVHWTTDVLAGWLIAVTWVTLLIALAPTDRRPAQRPPSEHP